MALLEVEVVSTTEVLWRGKAKQVTVPGVEGQVGILPGRQPLLVLIRPGDVVIVEESGQTQTLAVNDGFVALDSDKVTVCAS